MRYNDISKTKRNGIVYTPTRMANYLANELLTYKPPKNDEIITILDPAVGGGELIISMINSISAISNSKISVVGYETDSVVCVETQKKLLSLFPQVNVTIINQDFIQAVENNSIDKFDYVIANPPYIRTQILGSKKTKEISNKLGLTGRIDLYYAFIVCASDVIKEDGIAGFITSNKYLTIKSGNSVRDYMLQNFLIHRITDFGDTKLFPAAVLPCITVFSKGKTTNSHNVRFTSVYQSFNDECISTMVDLFDAIYQSGCFSLIDGRKYIFQQGTLRSTDKGALWTIQSDSIKEWIQRAEVNTWQYFSNLGKIRVGIKTTADNVFIREDWSDEVSDIELLKPLITHRNAGHILPANSVLWQVLYTHTTTNGKKVAHDISKYPNTQKYLNKYYTQLSGRKYLQAAKRNWYEIWVPQNPDAWKHRKIVFKDISEEPMFWLDTSGAIVNGDCYWIDIKDDVPDDVVYLALAIANSNFIEKYYDTKFNTKLYSGKRRYMSQYVEQFPIPLYTTENAQKVISIVKKIIAENNYESVLSYKCELNRMVEELFN